MKTKTAINIEELKKWPFPEQAFLGRGSFGTVTRGLYCNTPVAVKELLTGKEQMVELRRQAMAELLEEISILMEFRHPHIVCMVAFNSTYIVMEMYKGNARKLNSLDEVAVVGRDCMRGLAYMHLHDKCFIHGDVKPENILVNYDSFKNITKAALGDLGLARSCVQCLTKKEFSGTPGYMPMPNPCVDTTHDIYALAVSLLDAFLGSYPGEVHASNEEYNLDDNTMATLARFPDQHYQKVISDMLAAYKNGVQNKPEEKKAKFVRSVMLQWENIVSTSNVAAQKITSYDFMEDENMSMFIESSL